MNIFPSLKRIKIGRIYKKLPKNTLGRVKGKVLIGKDIDIEAILIEGKVKAKIKGEAERT